MPAYANKVARKPRSDVAVARKRADERAASAARVSDQAARYGMTAAEVIEANAVLYGLLTAEDVVELQRRRAKCER